MNFRGLRGFAACSPHRGRPGRAGTRARPRLGCIAGLLVLSACADPAPIESARHPIVNGAEEVGQVAVGALVTVEPWLGVTETFCTATAISDRWVLTSAGCLANRDPRATRFVRGIDARPDFTGRPDAGDMYAIDAFVLHPSYAAPDHNVALVHLSTPLPAGAETLDLSTTTLDSNIIGAALLCVGFGEPDVAAQGEAGLARSTSLTVDALGPSTFLTRYDGAGLCPADLGGPALIERAGAWEVVGVASALTGTAVEPCGGSYYHQRADVYAAWVFDTLDAPAPSCLDGGAVCHCEAACQASGACDDAVCYDKSCQEVYECTAGCANAECRLDCYLSGTEEARDDFDGLGRCATDNCGGLSAEEYTACVAAQCGAPLDACLPAQVGSLSCEEVYECTVQCDPSDLVCAQGCYVEGSAAAQSAFTAMLECFTSECGDLSDDAFSDCVQVECGEEVVACLPDQACALLGGDCPAGSACAPTGTGRASCYPSDELAEGSLCESNGDRLPCADGSYCIDTLCTRLCVEDEGCDGEHACVIPVFDTYPELGACRDAPDAGVPAADAGVTAADGGVGASGASRDEGGCRCVVTPAPAPVWVIGLGLVVGIFWRRGR